VQTASASTVEDTGSIGNGSTATVAATDQISGLDTTNLTVGGSTSRLQATAALTGTGTASNVSGDSLASAGDGSVVTGASGDAAIPDDTDIVVGNDLVGGAIFDARSTLGATASSVGANATANAGNSTTSVTGIDGVDLTVGDNAGTIFGQATSTVTAAASTSGSLTPAATAATANALQVATGVLDTTTTIGGDGNLTALSSLTGTATASNVGDTTDQDDDASATLTLSGTGVNNSAGNATVIGGSGNVLGQALTNGGATAQTVNGDAAGAAYVTSTGLNLSADASNITIGRSGVSSTLPATVRAMRVRYWYDGGWGDSFDSLNAGTLPAVVEVGLWFGATQAADEEELGVPDRVRAIAVPDAAGAEADFPAKGPAKEAMR
jgi:hypothetical protein